jgi:hypothetical protein
MLWKVRDDLEGGLIFGNTSHGASLHSPLDPLHKITRILSKKLSVTERPVKDNQGKLLVNENELQRWKEYFSEMLSKGGNGAEERLETSEEMIKLKISTDPISKEEFMKAIQ